MIKLTPEKPPYYENAPTLRVYKALLTQAGTTAPTATIITNTVGDIVWTRTGTGVYLGTLTGAFLINKTWPVISDNTGDNTATVTVARFNDNQLKIVTVDAIFNDGWLTNTPIEINTLN